MELFPSLVAKVLGFDAQRPEQVGGHTLSLRQQAEQQLFRPEMGLVAPAAFL